MPLVFLLLSPHGKSLILCRQSLRRTSTNQLYRYNALAGIADPSNSFFIIPVAHFPWSDKGRERRQKVDNSEARSAV